MSNAFARIAQRLNNVFALQDVEGAATQALFARLDAQIDTAVAALMGAPDDKAFAAAESKYGHIFKTFGNDGYRLGQEFDRIATVGETAFEKLGGSMSATSGLQGDFAALDGGLFAAGHDLAGFGAAMNGMAALPSQAGLPDACATAAGATSALATDFATLAKEAQTFTTAIDAHAGANWQALGAALAPTSAEFSALSQDFADFTSLLSGTGGALTFSGVLASLDKDFISLDNSLHGMAAPVAHLLVHAGAKGL